MQFNIPYVTCDKLDQRPGRLDPDPTSEQAVACETAGTKYMLDVAKVLGTDVSRPTPTDPTNGQWIVMLRSTAGPGPLDAT